MCWRRWNENKSVQNEKNSQLFLLNAASAINLHSLTAVITQQQFPLTLHWLIVIHQVHLLIKQPLCLGTNRVFKKKINRYIFLLVYCSRTEQEVVGI